MKGQGLIIKEIDRTGEINKKGRNLPTHGKNQRGREKKRRGVGIDVKGRG